MHWKLEMSLPMQSVSTTSPLACTNMSFIFSPPSSLTACSAVLCLSLMPLRCVVEYAAVWISGCPHEQRMYQKNQKQKQHTPVVLFLLTLDDLRM